MLKVLITCGPTWVAIDSVRVISNQSTGEMGHLIAQAFHLTGAKVTVIEGPVTDNLKLKGAKVLKYKFFDELSGLLKSECQKKYDIVIHAAAVSDFKPTNVYHSKIDSGKSLTIKLVKTIKLINQIKRLAPTTFLVGFKLEPDVNERNIGQYTKALFANAQCDAVIANSTVGTYKGYIVDADGNILCKAKKKKDIVNKLVDLLRS